MVDYPIGDLIAERVRAMGVKPFYKHFKHNGVNGPNMATVYSDRGQGVRAPGGVLQPLATRPAAQLKPGDFDWKAIFAGGVRWFHSGGIFAALSETTGEVIIEGMKAAKAAGAVISFDLNYRAKLWNIWGGHERAAGGHRAHRRERGRAGRQRRGPADGPGHPGPGSGRQVQARPERLLRDDRQGRQEVSAGQDRRHHPARGAFDQPAQLGRGGLDRRQDLRRADLRAGRARPRRRRRRLRRRASSTACSPAKTRQEAVKLGWAHGALLTTFPGDTTMATVEQVRAFAKGGSARIQR